MLELTGVEAAYGSILALKSVSLRVRQGQIVTVIGPNGAGKSTTLKTIAGLLQLKAGMVSFMNQSISGLPPHHIVRMGISLVPEGRRIFPELTVEENLRIGAITRREGTDVRDDAARLLGLFPALRGRERQLGGTLSGGEQQMLAIARALMSRPRLLMLDEPSLGLAPIVIEAVFELITEINARGTTILLVEQNAQIALAVADYGYVMETGRVVLEDTAEALMDNENVRRAYLGMQRAGEADAHARRSGRESA
jgi:branched-chain amino acid transport system ATP-binding protein